MFISFVMLKFFKIKLTLHLQFKCILSFVKYVSTAEQEMVEFKMSDIHIF